MDVAIDHFDVMDRLTDGNLPTRWRIKRIAQLAVDMPRTVGLRRRHKASDCSERFDKLCIGRCALKAIGIFFGDEACREFA